MKKYFENVFACTYAGYKQSEIDEPWKTDSVSRAIVILIIEQVGILIILATLCCKFFNIKIEDNTAYITFIVALLVVGIINSFYFTSERAEILYDKFCSKTNYNEDYCAF